MGTMANTSYHRTLSGSLPHRGTSAHVMFMKDFYQKALGATNPRSIYGKKWLRPGCVLGQTFPQKYRIFHL